MSVMASQITGVSIVDSTICSGEDQRKQSSASLAFVRGIHPWPVNSPHKGPVTRKMLPFDDVIMNGIHFIQELFHNNLNSMKISFNFPPNVNKMSPFAYDKTVVLLWYVQKFVM